MLVTAGGAILAVGVAYVQRGLAVGTAAPEFDLPGSDGRRYKLSDFRGRSAVVLAWFPRAQSRGCTLECKSLRDNASVLGQYRVQLFAVSVDRPEENRVFAGSLGLSYPILSDPDKVAARAYRVLARRGVANRQTIYISSAGQVLAVDRHVQVESAGQAMADQLARLGVPRVSR